MSVVSKAESPPLTDKTLGSTAAKSAWRLLRSVCGWIVLAFLGTVCCSAVAMLFVRAAYLPSAVSPGGMLIVVTVGQLGGAVILGFAALRHGQIAFSPGAGIEAQIGSVARGALVVLLGILIVAYALLLAFAGYAVRPDVLASALSIDLAVRIFSILVVVAIVPLTEELVFRGWMWAGLHPYWGALPTVAVTSVLWLAMHLEIGQLGKPVLLVPVAAVLGTSRYLARNVWAPIAIHACYNLAWVVSPWLFMLVAQI